MRLIFQVFWFIYLINKIKECNRFVQLLVFIVTHDPFVWKILSATHDFFNGASHLVWFYQHSFGHHIYTNIDGADPDIVTGM